MLGIFNKKNKDGEEMSFLGHLEALRWHIMRSVIAIVTAATVAFFYKEFLFDTILFGPKHPDFPTFKFMCWLSDVLNMGDALCIKNVDFKIINFDLSGQFTTHMMVALIAGLIIALPYVLWEFWRFFKPALYEKERKSAKGFVFYTSMLFVIGILFGYYVITPLSVNFLATYKVSESVDNFINLDSYIGTVTTVTLIAGIIFELPILMFFLTKIGLITPQFMRKYRKHSVVICLILAAVITPTSDITTMLLVAVPLYILYEISIFVSANVLKKAAKKANSK